MRDEFLGGVPLNPELVGYDQCKDLYERGLVATIECLAIALEQSAPFHSQHPIVQAWKEWARSEETLQNAKNADLIKRIREVSKWQV